MRELDRLLEEILNITVHQSTGLSPRELHFGKPVKEDIHRMIAFPTANAQSQEFLIAFAREQLIKSFDHRKKNQGSISKVPLEVDDLVLLRVRHLSNAFDRVIKKFFHLFEGPYRIIKKNGENACVLADVNDNSKVLGTYNRLNLRKYYSAGPNNM